MTPQTRGRSTRSIRSRSAGLMALIVASTLAIVGCTPGAGDGPDPNADTTLRILAGSEARDMEPLLAEAAKATGVSVVFTYAGTLDGAEQVASGTAGQSYDATWFSSNRYLGLLPDGNRALSTSTKIMSSPVVLGVRESSAKRLGWDDDAPTWAEIGAAAKSGEFTYGMTNPASSNSGFSALVGVATAFAGAGNAIDAGQIDSVTPQLAAFFSGQKLTSGSSGWLADRFVESTKVPGATPVDGMINYESVLLDLGARGHLPEKLTLVYPADGVVSADYPLSLLATASPGKRESYRKLTDWLRTPEAQRLVMERTHRRPVVPGVQLSGEFGQRLLVELPFPAQRSAADGLITAYLDKASRPSQTIYVLDTSGSMSGSRLDQLKKAFTTLAGKAPTTSAGFTRFRHRERVTIIAFDDRPEPARQYEVPKDDPSATLLQIESQVRALQAGGETAIYDSLAAAYRQAAEEVAARPDSFTSVVLMTDGEKTTGRDLDAFLGTYDALPAEVRAVPTFTVLFGESDVEEMNQVAERTGGKVFDARGTSLETVFKEIRGYQ